MRSLYEIDSAITSLVDQETGEIMDYEAFAALSMEREQKVEGMALWYKDLCAEAAAIKAEEKNLADRRKSVEANAERLKEYLLEATGGEKFKTPRVACTFRTSQKVEIQDEAEFIRSMQENMHYEYLTFSKPTVNKAAITKAIKDGQTVEGAELVTKLNITIK